MSKAKRALKVFWYLGKTKAEDTFREDKTSTFIHEDKMRNHQNENHKPVAMSSIVRAMLAKTINNFAQKGHPSDDEHASTLGIGGASFLPPQIEREVPPG